MWSHVSVRTGSGFIVKHSTAGACRCGPPMKRQTAVRSYPERIKTATNHYATNTVGRVWEWVWVWGGGEGGGEGQKINMAMTSWAILYWFCFSFSFHFFPVPFLSFYHFFSFSFFSFSFSFFFFRLSLEYHVRRSSDQAKCKTNTLSGFYLSWTLIFWQDTSFSGVKINPLSSFTHWNLICPLFIC